MDFYKDIFSWKIWSNNNVQSFPKTLGAIHSLYHLGRKDLTKFLQSICPKSSHPKAALLLFESLSQIPFNWGLKSHSLLLRGTLLHWL